VAAIDVAGMAQEEQGMTAKHTYAPEPTEAESGYSVVAPSRMRLKKPGLVNGITVCAGFALNIFSYGSLVPVVVTVLMFLLIYSFLVITPLGGAPERRMFRRVYAVGFMVAGIAAIYVNQFQDQSQLFSDAGGLYDMAIGGSVGLSLLELRAFHEGSLVIMIWSAVYDFFAYIGFEKGRYIGVSVNIAAVALAGVIGIKIVRKIFGEDEYRFHRLTILVAGCGLFWLFASIHVRDSVILLAVTALAYSWIHFLTKPDIGWRLMQVVVWSLAAGASFGFLRREFAFVPIAMGLAAVAALYIGKADKQRMWVVYSLMLLGSAVLLFLITNYYEGITVSLDRGYIGYRDQGVEQSAGDSLGMALIVNQAMPIRLVLGSIYLLVFPIPFWSGFQFDNAYNLFKSFNVIFFYFLIPLLAIALGRLFGSRTMRTPAMMFVLLTALGFTLAVAATSLETRHFGAFLMPIFVLATVPDLRERKTWRRYKNYVSFVLVGVVSVHLAWIALKVF